MAKAQDKSKVQQNYERRAIKDWPVSDGRVLAAGEGGGKAAGGPGAMKRTTLSDAQPDYRRFIEDLKARIEFSWEGQEELDHANGNGKESRLLRQRQ